MTRMETRESERERILPPPAANVLVFLVRVDTGVARCCAKKPALRLIFVLLPRFNCCQSRHCPMQMSRRRRVIASLLSNGNPPFSSGCTRPRKASIHGSELLPSQTTCSVASEGSRQADRLKPSPRLHLPSVNLRHTTQCPHTSRPDRPTSSQDMSTTGSRSDQVPPSAATSWPADLARGLQLTANLRNQKKNRREQVY